MKIIDYRLINIEDIFKDELYYKENRDKYKIGSEEYRWWNAKLEAIIHIEKYLSSFENLAEKIYMEGALMGSLCTQNYKQEEVVTKVRESKEIFINSDISIL